MRKNRSKRVIELEEAPTLGSSYVTSAEAAEALGFSHDRVEKIDWQRQD